MDVLADVERGRPAEPVPVLEAALPAGSGALVRQLSAKVQEGAMHPRLAVAIVTRLVAQQRAPQPCLSKPLDLPLVTDAASFAETTRRILAAVAAGELAPLEAERLGRLARAAWQATVAEVRARHRLR